MKTNLVETRYETLAAIGHALKRGRVRFAEATRLRDLARSGQHGEVKKRLRAQEPTRHS